jgi:hypothetical protein
LFTEDDVRDLQPLVSSGVPACGDGEQKLSTGQMLLTAAHSELQQVALSLTQARERLSARVQQLQAEGQLSEEALAQLDVEDDAAEHTARTSEALQMERARQAADLLEDALATLSFHHGVAHVRVAEAFAVCADAFSMLGERQVAADYAQRAWLLYRRVCGADSYLTLAATTRLATTLDALAEDEELNLLSEQAEDAAGSLAMENARLLMDPAAPQSPLAAELWSLSSAHVRRALQLYRLCAGGANHLGAFTVCLQKATQHADRRHTAAAIACFDDGIAVLDRTMQSALAAHPETVIIPVPPPVDPSAFGALGVAGVRSIVSGAMQALVSAHQAVMELYLQSGDFTQAGARAQKCMTLLQQLFGSDDARVKQAARTVQDCQMYERLMGNAADSSFDSLSAQLSKPDGANKSSSASSSKPSTSSASASSPSSSSASSTTSSSSSSAGSMEEQKQRLMELTRQLFSSMGNNPAVASRLVAEAVVSGATAVPSSSSSSSSSSDAVFIYFF